MPGEVPSGWERTTLGRITAPVNRTGGSAELPVLSVSKVLGIVPQGEKFKKRIASADTARYRRVRHGEFAYDPMLLWDGSISCQTRVPEGLISPAYEVFLATEAVDHGYLLFLLKCPEMVSVYRNVSVGTNVRRKQADYGTFARIEVTLPPLPEQKKIAVILSSVDEAIQATQAVIDQTRRVKEGLLQDLLTHGLPGHTRFKQTEIGEIPESWEVRPLEEVLERLIDYRGKPPPKANDGIPLLTAKNVREGYINPEPREFIPHDMWDEWMVRGLPQVGDVLFTTEAPLGMVAMLLTDRVALGQRLLCLRPAPSVYHGGFLLQVLLSSGFQGRCASRATGSTALGIKQSTFRQMLVPVPPLSEQKLVAEIVGQVAATQSQAETDIAGLRRLKTGLLQDLLTGKVRVSP